MENVFYLVSAHSTCIEGLCLSKKNHDLLITGDTIGFSESESSDSGETSVPETDQWTVKIREFLDQQQWRDHAISFLLPAEDVSFRKITFPFQERKKVEQALPYELEEELMSDLSENAYSTQVYTMSEQNSEALVLLMGKQRLKQLQKLCLERDLLIRNVDCSAHALYRSMLNGETRFPETGDVFQIYLGGDEAFMNTIRDGRLDEIKIFPNRIPLILQKHLASVGNSLPAFLQNFVKHADNVDLADEDNEKIESFTQLKQELHRLCSQLTLHLRIKNYIYESQIEIHGILGPMIKWDGVVFKVRSFPLPESDAFAERSGNNELVSDRSSHAVKLYPQTGGKTPDTLEELMKEAKQREESEGEPSKDEESAENKSSEKIRKDQQSSSQLTSVNPQSSLLTLLEREHWGVLGELRDQAELFVESHQLSLYHESTPWRRFLQRNRGAVAVAVGLMIIIFTGIFWQTKTKLDLLRQEIAKSDRLIQTELRRAVPKTSASGLNSMLLELKEKIEQRKKYIGISKDFERREYNNLNFLKSISSLLSEDAPFQVDSMEYAPERFSLSGTIDSYDRLQLLKKNLQSIEEFKNKEIVESNRKSPDGIVYRISIDLK
ncbi:MAG: hypothetical protein MAG581_00899 [Deltaproteobacteria bacterium]|jgi:hypothetical protein|nr:hypothetical protein [Deltaproteobacteria bacterium]